MLSDRPLCVYCGRIRPRLQDSPQWLPTLCPLVGVRSAWLASHTIAGRSSITPERNASLQNLAASSRIMANSRQFAKPKDFCIRRESRNSRLCRQVLTMAVFVEEWSIWDVCVSPQRAISLYLRSGQNLRPALPQFAVSNGVWQSYPTSRIRLNIVAETVLQNALDEGMKLRLSNKVFELEYASETDSLGDNAQII